MMRFKIFILYLFVVSINSEILPSKARRCGEWFDSAAGGVFYKPFEPVLEHERCVWIISHPGAVSYNITLQFLGSPTNQPDSDQELILTGITHNTRGPPTLVHEKPTELGTYAFPNVNMVIATFVLSNSSDGPSYGFSFQYQTHESGIVNSTSRASTHHIFESPTWEFHYPETSGSKYDAMELAAFVFPPADSYYKGKDKLVWWKQDEIEANCTDSLFVYTFTKDATELDLKWQESDQLCGDTTSKSITHDDIVLVLFQTDDIITTVYSGFWFYFLGC